MRRSWNLFFLFLIGSMHGLLAQELSYMELETKISSSNQRIAGTLRVHVRGGITDAEWQLPRGLEVARVTINEQPASFRSSPGGFRILPATANKQLQRVAVVFSGTPPTEAATFRIDEEGFPWIQFSDGPSARWHPWVPQAWRTPDSLWNALILPDGLRPITEGKLKEVTNWPGGDKRWVFSQQVMNGVPTWYIGNYVRFSNIQQTNRGLREWHFWVPQSRLEHAQVHYAEVPGILRVLAEHWGPMPAKGLEPQRWIEEPGSNLHGSHLYGRKAPGYSPLLVREVASRWIGAMDLAKGSPIREAFFQQAEWLWIEHQFSEKVRENVMEGYRTNPAFWGGWLVNHWITGDNPAWRQQLPGLLALSRNPLADDEALRAWIVDHIDRDLDIVMRQYLDRKTLPVFEFSIEKRRRKSVIRYRWGNVEEGFEWPVEIVQQGEAIILKPSKNWKEHAWPKAGGKSLSIDEAQGLFEIRSQ
ncbi:MAG: hypothetical protein NWR72_04195 [Bacteroidia bacterium]|nr:hypothetical protein [Bacteroidia bacterium]